MLTPLVLEGEPGAATLLLDSMDSETTSLSSRNIPKKRTVPVGVERAVSVS